MLTGRLVRVRYARQRIVPGYVDAAAPEWQEVAERLLELFRGQEGQSRGAIEDDVRETFDSDPQQLVHQGLAKLLEDRCEFEVVSGHPPEKLRERVFRAAARRRTDLAAARDPKAPPSPPTPFRREEVLQEVADEVGLTPAAVDHGLFADLKSEQRLVKFQDLTAERLLLRYNVALAQAVLLRSTGVKIFIRNEPPQRYRQLLRAVKFHRLIAEVRKTGPDCYCLHLDGPLSLFSATQKYGLQLALFLPVLLPCRDFELEAELKWGPERKPKTFTLSSADGLVSHLADSGMYVPPELGMFAELFRKKAKGWEIAEEVDVLPLGDGFWVPDYRLVQQSTGRTVLLEVLGFWRRASAEKHLARLRAQAGRPFVLAVSDQLHIDDAELADFPAGIHRFRQMPLPDEVVKLAEAALSG
jgi:predicted nuclease of restriction endonuclease-like RecB superfamily